MSVYNNTSYYKTLYPESNLFLETYIESILAISTYKVGANSYNIKAPNFKQDLGYIGFIKANSNTAIEGQRLIDLARYITLIFIYLYFIELTLYFRSNKLKNTIILLAIYRDLDKISLSSRPIKVLVSIGIKNSFIGFTKVFLGRLKIVYSRILVKEGYNIPKAPYSNIPPPTYNNKSKSFNYNKKEGNKVLKKEKKKENTLKKEKKKEKKEKKEKNLSLSLPISTSKLLEYISTLEARIEDTTILRNKEIEIDTISKEENREEDEKKDIENLKKELSLNFREEFKEDILEDIVLDEEKKEESIDKEFTIDFNIDID